MKKFLSFALAAILAVVFSAFTTKRTSDKTDQYWYRIPATNDYAPYTGDITPCDKPGSTQCVLFVEEEEANCPIFLDDEGDMPLLYDPF